MLPERTKLNKYAINLKDNKQPSYRQIYSLGSMKLETLKIYIKTYLKIGFIWPSKSPTGAPYYLIKSRITSSAYILIIEVSTISQSKTGSSILDWKVTQQIWLSKKVYLVGFN